jgi:hypothetical protein
MHMIVIWNIDSTYVLSIYEQSMIICYMTHLPIDVFTIDWIIQYVWMTLIHLGCRQEILFLWLTSKIPSIESAVPKWHTFVSKRQNREKKTIKEKTQIWHNGKTHDLKKSENSVFEGYGENHKWTHKNCHALAAGGGLGAPYASYRAAVPHPNTFVGDVAPTTVGSYIHRCHIINK